MKHVARRDAVKSLGLAAAALALPARESLASDTSRSRDARSRDARSAIERWLRLTGVPSASVAQIDGDRITHSFFGVKQVGSTDRPTENSGYAAASLSKSMFTYAFLSMVDEGLLSLDVPVAEYIALPNPADERAKKITSRHLLSHSGGWRNWRNVATVPMLADFEPGSRWSYSGEGFFHLQRIVEKVAAKSVGQVLRERVFTPLGMKHTSIVLTPELDAEYLPPHDGRGALTTGFGRSIMTELRRQMAARNTPVEFATIEDAETALKAAEPTLPVLPNFYTLNVAGSMVTTAGDFGLFLRHLVTARRHGGQAARIVNLMMTPQIRCNEAVQWGLGVGLDDIDNTRFFWQWGDNTGYKNIYFADPAKERAIAIFTNSDRGQRVYERAVRELTQIDHPAFLWI